MTNFEHTNVVGDRGYQNILGWYKDEAKYQQPVTDSYFDITAIGNGMPIINQAGSGNTYVALVRVIGGLHRHSHTDMTTSPPAPEIRRNIPRFVIHISEL